MAGHLRQGHRRSARQHADRFGAAHGSGVVEIKYLLTGLILCGKCGDKMYACPAENPRRMIYRCLKTHLARGLRDVDEVVEAAVIARLSRSDAADLYAPDVDLDALRARVTELRERRDGLAGLLADGLLSPAVVRR